jgi:hypothetical protein
MWYVICITKGYAMNEWNCTTEEFFRFENEAYIEPDWDNQPPSFFEE